MGEASHSKRREELSLGKETSKCKDLEIGEFSVYKEEKGVQGDG